MKNEGSSLRIAVIQFNLNKTAEMNFPAASRGVSLRTAHTRCGSTVLNSALRTLFFRNAASGGEFNPQRLNRLIMKISDKKAEKFLPSLLFSFGSFKNPLFLSVLQN